MIRRKDAPNFRSSPNVFVPSIKNTKYAARFKPNQRIGSWKILESTVYMDEKSRSFIKCQCDCGNEEFVAAHHLAKGQTTRCESCNYELRNTNQNPNWRGSGFVPKTMINYLSSSAAARNVPFNINTEYANTLYMSSSATCALSGQPISIANNTAKLVAVDPAKGYVYGNVEWVHSSLAPSLKNTPTNKFIAMCVNVAEKSQFKKE